MAYDEVSDGNHFAAIDDLTFNNGAATPQIGVSTAGEVYVYTSGKSAATAGAGVSIGRFGGSTGPVTLAVSGLPPGVTGQFATNPFTGGNGATDTLTLHAPAGTPGHALMNATVTATPSTPAGSQPVTATLPVHVVNAYSVGGLGISLTQSTGITADETASSAPQTAQSGHTVAYDGIIPSGIPLVAGAPTTVHVFADPAGLVGVGTSGLTAKLYGYNGNHPLPGSPLSPHPASPPSLSDQPISSQAGQPGTSFDFVLPSSWTPHGSITLMAHVTGPGQLFTISPDPTPNATADCTDCQVDPSGITLGMSDVKYLTGVRRISANQCTPESSFTSAHKYSSVVCDVPQINQMRPYCSPHAAPITDNCLSAPNDWCVPTAAMDIFAAFADRGALTKPAKKNWSKPANYNEMTRDLYRLGSLMHTAEDANGHYTGGGTGNSTPGADAWLSGAQSLPFLVWSSVSMPAWSAPHDPDPLRLIAIDQAFGGLANANLGFFENATPHPSDNPLTHFNPPPGAAAISTSGAFNPLDSYRYDGHEVAVTGITVNSSGASIEIHDPAQPFKGLSAQTPYETDIYHLGPVRELRSYGPSTSNPYSNPHNLKTRPASNGKGTLGSDIAARELESYWTNGVVTPNINERTYIDGYSTLTPSILAFPETNSSIAEISDPAAHYHEHVYKVAGGVEHLALDPLDPEVIYYSAAGGSTIHVLNVATRHVSTFANPGAPILQLAGGGVHDGVFARTANEVVSFDPAGRKVGVVHGAFSTIAVDGSDEGLLAASIGKRTVDTYSPTLHLVGSSVLPSSLTNGNGQLLLAVDLTSGQLLVRSPAGSLYRAGLAAGALTVHVASAGGTVLPSRISPTHLKLGTGGAPTILADNGDGALFGVSHGVLTTYRANGKRTKSPFGTVHLHGELAVTEAFNNVLPILLPAQ